LACEALANDREVRPRDQARCGSAPQRHGRHEIKDDGCRGADAYGPAPELQGLPPGRRHRRRTCASSPPGRGPCHATAVRGVSRTTPLLLACIAFRSYAAEGNYVVAEASRTRTTLRGRLAPATDVVHIVDIRMPPTRPTSASCRALRSRRLHPQMGVVLLSHHGSRRRHQLLGRGAAGPRLPAQDRVCDPQTRRLAATRAGVARTTRPEWFWLLAILERTARCDRWSPGASVLELVPKAARTGRSPSAWSSPGRRGRTREHDLNKLGSSRRGRPTGASSRCALVLGPAAQIYRLCLRGEGRVEEGRANRRLSLEFPSGHGYVRAPAKLDPPHETPQDHRRYAPGERTGGRERC